MAKRQQFDLFSDEAAARTGATGLVAIPRGRAPLGREQKAFNRQASRVRRLREALATWQDYARRYDARIQAELLPARDALRDAQRRLALRLDALARARGRGERLSRAQRRAVGRHIELLVADLLEGGERDPELEALHDAYAETPYAERARAELDELGSALGEMFGDEALAGHRASNPEELFEHLREHVEATQRAAGPHAGAGSARARHAAARKASERTEALGTVRSIWRKLASAVHPDREADPAERARKTALMQRANDAYERNDVLTLLSLQIELEQIDADHLAGAPPQRLRHFVTVLKEQADALEQELEECLLQFRILLDRPRGQLRTQMVDAELERELAQMREMTFTIEHDLARLDDPRGRRELLATLLAEEQARDAIDELGILEGLPPGDELIAAIAELAAMEERTRTADARGQKKQKKTKRKVTKKAKARTSAPRRKST